MGMVAPAAQIASAAVVHVGSFGSVMLYAQQRGVSRKRIYRESRGLVSLEGTGRQQLIVALQQEIATLRQQVAEGERCLALSAVLEPTKRRSLPVSRSRWGEFGASATLVGGVLG